MRKILEEETNLKLVSVHPSKLGLVYINIFTAIHFVTLAKTYKCLTEYAGFRMPPRRYTNARSFYISFVNQVFPKQPFPTPRGCGLGSFVQQDLRMRGLFQMIRNYLSISSLLLSLLP